MSKIVYEFNIVIDKELNPELNTDYDLGAFASALEDYVNDLCDTYGITLTT